MINGNGISIDTTHTEANAFKATSERVMKRLAKKIFKTVEKENGKMPDDINQDIPDYTEIKDHIEAKAPMKSYLEETITKIEESVNLEVSPKTKAVIENTKEILGDPKFIQQKGVRSIVDQDARVGHKSKTQNFFGYKTEYMITTEDRMITTVRVNPGHIGTGSCLMN